MPLKKTIGIHELKVLKDFLRYSSEAVSQEYGFYIRLTSLFLLSPLKCLSPACI